MFRHHPDNAFKPKHTFPNLLPTCISDSPPDPKQTLSPSNLHIDSTLAAPPGWKLNRYRPVETPQTIGYTVMHLL